MHELIYGGWQSSSYPINWELKTLSLKISMTLDAATREILYKVDPWVFAITGIYEVRGKSSYSVNNMMNSGASYTLTLRTSVSTAP